MASYFNDLIRWVAHHNLVGFELVFSFHDDSRVEIPAVSVISVIKLLSLLTPIS